MSITRKYKFKTKCKHCGHIDGMSRSDIDICKIKCAKCKKTGTTKYIKVKRHKTLTQFRLENSGKKK